MQVNRENAEMKHLYARKARPYGLAFLHFSILLDIQIILLRTCPTLLLFERLLRCIPLHWELL